MNRQQRRFKAKVRSGSTKGMAKVMFLDEEEATPKYVKTGSKIHLQALNNSKAFRKNFRSAKINLINKDKNDQT